MIGQECYLSFMRRFITANSRTIDTIWSSTDTRKLFTAGLRRCRTNSPDQSNRSTKCPTPRPYSEPYQTSFDSIQSAQPRAPLPMSVKDSTVSIVLELAVSGWGNER